MLDLTGSECNAEGPLYSDGEDGVSAWQGENHTGEASGESNQETRVSGKKEK